MIFLWGLLEDDTFRSVHGALRQRGAPVAFINHAAIGHSRVRMTTRPELGHCFICHDTTYYLEEMSAAYLRPYDPRDYVDRTVGGTGSGAVSPTDLVHYLLNDWAESSQATIVNRPSAEATNHSKLRQALDIEAAGFQVPDSLVSNDKQEIRAFQARHGHVVFKSMSSVRSIVRELDPGMLDRAGALGPVLFQQRVAGRNVRVHVVRDAVFACAVRSEGVDYRYAASSIEAIALPADVAERCIALAQRLGLLLAGIDLIETPAGDWYCLEVNPNPAFSFFDHSGADVIAHAVAGLLMS
jgi:RimK-like ATP-grasp domain